MPKLIILSLLACLLLPFTAYAKNVDEITGLWLTKKQDVAVRLEHCGSEGLCGYIAWLDAKESVENPSLCGTKVLWNVQPNGDDRTEWVGGTLYKADKKKYYGADIRLVNANTLSLRAYIGVPLLGKTKKLTRTSESTHPPCQLPEKN